MSTATAYAEDADRAQEESLAAQYFRQVTYETHAPGTSRRIAGVDAYKDEHKLDDDRVKPLEVAVIPEQLAARIVRSRNAIRALFQKYTMATNRPGVRLVALKRKDDFYERLNAAIAEFNATADEAESRWDEIRQYNHDYWRPKFKTEEEYEEAVGRKLPGSAAELRARFSVSIADEEPHRALGDLEDEAAAQFFKDCIENGKKLRQELDFDLRVRPMEAMVAAAKKLDRQLEVGERLSPQTFTGVIDAINKLEQCAQFTDAQVLDRVRALQKRISRVVGDARAASVEGLTMTEAIAGSQALLTRLIDDAVATCDEAIAEQNELLRSEYRSRGFEFTKEEEEE